MWQLALEKDTDKDAPTSKTFFAYLSIPCCLFACLIHHAGCVAVSVGRENASFTQKAVFTLYAILGFPTVCLLFLPLSVNLSLYLFYFKLAFIQLEINSLNITYCSRMK